MMKTTVKEASQCPSCGRPMPAGALAGLCPACLLAQGAESDEGGGFPRFEPPPIAEVARLFPQLEILDLLGAGGMGAVYKARQPALDRIVALKILPSGGPGGANFEERFNREARALARLNHPNIVAVYEFGLAGVLHYFIMEYVDGANLRLLEQGSRLSPREALQIIPQICDALQYAHDEGVVHRDIKPENVLVDRKGRVKIADFGLAKILGQDPATLRLTAEGQVMGTPHYMAPEQIERPLAVDHRADIYSLGVVLYEMLTGDLPLGKFPAPSSKVQIDVRFDEVVLRALENDPARRYQKASDVKTRVETISGEPVPVSNPQPAGTTEQCLGWLGFAVVKESDGGRSINWKGTWAVFGVTFGLLSIAFGFVTAFTGQSVLGWIGVKGWPSVVARIAITTLIVTWGVWRALRLKGDAESLPRTPQGTVILSSSTRRWGIGRRLVIASLMVLAWCVFQVQWLTPKLKSLSAGRSSVQTAIRDEESGTLVANLPGGGVIELIALASTSGQSHEWWRPDGSRVTNETLEIRGPAEIATPGMQKKDVAFRIVGVPPGPDSVSYDFGPEANVSDGGQVLLNGSVVPGGWPTRVAWPAAVKTATLRLGYGRDPWRTIWTHNPADHSSRRTELAGDLKWTTSLNQARDDGNDTYLTMVLGPNTKNWKLRLAAVGIDGVERFHRRASGTPAETSTTWTYTFPGMTLKQVKEFRLEVQPVRWVEFRDVALRGKGIADNAAAGLKFGPVMERTFSELLDLDTGETGSFPQDETKGENPFEGLARSLAWMQAQGFDILAGPDKLETLGVKVVELASADWDSLTPDSLINRLQNGGGFPSELRPAGGTFPATFGFRTREGSTGLLQLVALMNASPNTGARVRFKLTQTTEGRSRQASSRPDLEDLREAKAALAKLQVAFTGTHPYVQAARSRVAELERMSREEPAASVELREAKAHLAELRVSFGEGNPVVQQALESIRALEAR